MSIVTAQELESIVCDYEDSVADDRERTEELGTTSEDISVYGLENMNKKDGSLLRLLHDYGFLTDRELKAVLDEVKEEKKDLREILVGKWISADTYQTLMMFVTGKKGAK